MGKRMYLPCHETDGLDDGGLDDFFAWEDAPCYRVGTVRVGVCAEVTTVVDNVICDVDVALDV